MWRETCGTSLRCGVFTSAYSFCISMKGQEGQQTTQCARPCPSWKFLVRVDTYWTRSKSDWVAPGGGRARSRRKNSRFAFQIPTTISCRSDRGFCATFVQLRFLSSSPILYILASLILTMVSSIFADRPIKKLVLFDVDGTLTPARKVRLFPNMHRPRSSQLFR